MRLIPSLLVLLLAPSVSATTFYVDSSITDTNVASATPDFTAYNPATFATTGGSASVHKTIADINAKTTLAAGDSVLFRMGQTWRETMNIPSSGSSGNHVIFGSFGTGNKPRIFGSTQQSGWTVSGSVWQVSSAVTPDAIWFVDTDGTTTHWGRKQASLGAVVALYDWFASGSVISVYSGGTSAGFDPDTLWGSVEIPTRQFGIDINSKDYITIDGFDIRYTGTSSAGRGVRDLVTVATRTGLTIQNCNVSYIGYPGTGSGNCIMTGHATSLIQNNTVSECGRRGIDVWVNSTGITVTNVIIQNNLIFNTYHTGVDVQLHLGAMSDLTVRYNYVYQDTSADLVAPYSYSMDHIFVEGDTTSGMILDNAKVYGNVVVNPSENGIHIFSNVSNFSVTNNTFYGVNPFQTIGGAHLKVDTGTSGSNSIKNNLFYGNHVPAMGTWANIWLGNPAQVADINYNLYYQTDAAAKIYRNQGTGTTYTMAQWATLKSATGFEANSPTPADPLFVTNGSNFALQATSPAINVGANLGSTYQTAFLTGSAWPDALLTGNQNSYGVGWEIGTYIYGAQSSPRASTIGKTQIQGSVVIK